jgi:hypothetical protein
MFVLKSVDLLKLLLCKAINCDEILLKSPNTLHVLQRPRRNEWADCPACCCSAAAGTELLLLLLPP